MKLFSSEHRFLYHYAFSIAILISSYPWETVSSANWLKYPNKNTSHVTNVDYLWRHIDPQTGCLHTGRLITCKQAGPAFLASFLAGSDSNAMALEESVVDPRNRRLSIKSRNLTLSNIISVEESCVYTPSADTLGYGHLNSLRLTHVEPRSSRRHRLPSPAGCSSRTISKTFASSASR